VLKGGSDEKPPMDFEVVPIPPLAAHADRLPAVPVKELPDYVPSAIGHKAALAQAWIDTRPYYDE
jgi:hypothetical protein